jgi:ABC-type lipoprotein release transport system permease subunit
MISGVTGVSDRVWGFYPFDYLNTNLTIVGVDIFEPGISETLKEVTNGLNIMSLRSGGSMLIGSQLQSILRQIYDKDEFSFQKPNGEYVTLHTAGVFNTKSQMISTGTIITDKNTASVILGIPDGMSTDIAVNVANQQEISTVQEKIENMSPSLRVITKEVIGASYQNMFDYKGGIFLLFFISSIFTFFVIIFDRLSNVSGTETKETAILKAVGWTTSDVLKVRLYESVIISVTAYISAVLLSLIYVFALQAPGLKNIFMGYSYLKPHFTIPFVIEPAVYISVFLITVPVYAASVIIPSWRAASIDSGEVIR